ncbi:hypothetical protein HK104_004759 [Borealophlyctis nickersoniae]|nr:hypothetical protein HK104_004759 [Borealophlyctis nickersoniae]
MAAGTDSHEPEQPEPAPAVSQPKTALGTEPATEQKPSAPSTPANPAPTAPTVAGISQRERDRIRGVAQLKSAFEAKIAHETKIARQDPVAGLGSASNAAAAASPPTAKTDAVNPLQRKSSSGSPSARLSARATAAEAKSAELEAEVAALKEELATKEKNTRLESEFPIVEKEKLDLADKNAQLEEQVAALKAELSARDNMAGMVAALKAELAGMKVKDPGENAPTSDQPASIQPTPILSAGPVDSYQLTIDHHLLLSYRNDLQYATEQLPRSPWDDLAAPNPSPASSHAPSELELFITHLHKLITAAMRAAELERRAQDTDARLRARDMYLQKAIMDTAHQVSDLEQKVHDLQSINEGLKHEISHARQAKERLEMELAELDDDNLMLQNELVKADGDGSGPPSPHDAAQGEDGGENVGEGPVWEWENDYVLLRDIATQTDAKVGGERSVGVGVGVGTDMATQTYDASKPEMRLLSLTSRLTYANLLAETQHETIEELEKQVEEARAQVDRLTALNWELKLRGEHMTAIGETNRRVIEELAGKLERVEEKRSAKAMTMNALRLIFAADVENGGSGTYDMVPSVASLLGLRPRSSSDLIGKAGAPRAPPNTPLPAPPLLPASTAPAPTSNLPEHPDAGASSGSSPSRAFRFQARRSLVATPPEVHRRSVELHRQSLELTEEDAFELMNSNGISAGGPSPVMASKTRRVTAISVLTPFSRNIPATSTSPNFPDSSTSAAPYHSHLSARPFEFASAAAYASTPHPSGITASVSTSQRVAGLDSETKVGSEKFVGIS